MSGGGTGGGSGPGLVDITGASTGPQSVSMGPVNYGGYGGLINGLSGAASALQGANPQQGAPQAPGMASARAGRLQIPQVPSLSQLSAGQRIGAQLALSQAGGGASSLAPWLMQMGNR